MDLPLFYNINIFIYSQYNDKNKIDITIASIKNQQYLMYKYQIIDNIINIYNDTEFNANDLVLILEAGDIFNNIKVLYNLNKEYLNTKFYSLLSSNNHIIKEAIIDNTLVQYNFRLLFRNGLINYVNLKLFNTVENFYSVVLNLTFHLNSLVGKQHFINLPIDYQKINFKFKNYQQHVASITFPTQLVLATYKRNYYIDIVLNNLSNHSYKNFELTLIDNNDDIKTQIELDSILKKYKETLKIKLIRNNFNYHCMSRFYFARNYVIKNNIADYVIIFDDDHEFEMDWVKKMIIEFKPLKIFSWFVKNFSVINYWKGKSCDELFTYFGPGGSIIDSSFFIYNPLFNFNEYSINAIKLDDIWGSFIFNRFLGINFIRSSLHKPINLNIKYKKNHKNKIYNTYNTMRHKKNKMLTMLHSQYGWEITKQQHVTNTINNYFDKIYLLEDHSNELVEQLKEHNIVASYKSKQDLEAVTNNNTRILVFMNNIKLSKNFIHNFDYFVMENQIEKFIDKYENMNLIFILKEPLIEHIPHYKKVNIYLSHPHINCEISNNFNKIDDSYNGDGLIIYINNHMNNIFSRDIIQKSLISFTQNKKTEAREIKINKNINYDTIMETYLPYYYKSTLSKHFVIYDSIKLFNKIKKSIDNISPHKTYIYHN